MLTTRYTFCSLKQSCPDGADPTALFQASDGDFYGTTLDGGTVNSGTVFRITPVGDFTSLYSFCTVSNTTSACADGGNPGALVEGRRSSIQLNVTENFLSKDWNMTSTWSNGGHTFEVHGTRLYLQASVEPVGDVDLPDQDDACFLSLAQTTGAWLVTGNLKHYPVQSRGASLSLPLRNTWPFWRKRHELKGGNDPHYGRMRGNLNNTLYRARPRMRVRTRQWLRR
jgi:uncharacterized repeat protein (TIGR03803 family)